MPEEKWIDWHPEVGDVRPQKYRWRGKNQDGWTEGTAIGDPIDEADLRWNDFQIPAPVESQEARPPWIDPQCKFRWGDRVRDKQGHVWFVNNPYEPDDDDADPPCPVVCTKGLWDYPPYSSYVVGLYDDNLQIFEEDDLELFPEELPPHFDPDQVKPVVPVPARKPREIWLNQFEAGLWYYVFLSEESARQMPGVPKATQVLFREVLPQSTTQE